MSAPRTEASSRQSGSTQGGRERVRKRAPNACNRCRQQKIKCSGSHPCSHCTKRSLPCTFVDKQRSVLVPQGVLAELERSAARARHIEENTISNESQDNSRSSAIDTIATTTQYSPQVSRSPLRNIATGPINHATPTPTANLDIDQQSESEHGESGAASVQEQPFINPLVYGPSAFTSVPTGQQAFYFGTTSNWSFGRRALQLVHNRVFGAPLPSANLHFDGATYELDWDGRRSTADIGKPALPTADFALFLINAVKFHCGQLFHVFDEDVFMYHFGIFHEGPDGQSRVPDLWYIHYLFVLALGKSMVGRMCTGRKPSGAHLFVHGMQILPDTMFLWKDPLQSTEVLCCAALYLQCLDMRIAAYNIIGQAMRTAIGYGFHTDMPNHHHTPAALERCRKIWWTIYIVDCHMSALLGAPRTIAEQDIGAQLPNFAGSTQRAQALHVHIKLANIEGLIQQTVYSKEGRSGTNFLKSMKTALKALADINDERTSAFPLQLEIPSISISRLSAHLHLFHHQCIILNTKPLLFSFLQRRVDTAMPIRIPSTGGVRQLLRVCVGSARQTTKILAALQSQTLLDVFIPFDLESTWSAALVLLITPVVDPTLAKDTESSLKVAYDVLDEMAAVGNIIAEFRRAELDQLERTLRSLETMNVPPDSAHDSAMEREADLAQYEMNQPGSAQSDNDFMSSHSYDFGDAMSGQQLEAVADSLHLNGLDWLWAAGSLDQLDTSLL